MKVWMIISHRNEWPYDIDWDGPFISKNYVFTKSIWKDDPWVVCEPTDPKHYLYKADTRGWTLYMQEVEVEGS